MAVRFFSGNFQNACNFLREPSYTLKMLSKSRFNLETAVQDNKVMQDFDLESLPMGADHSQMVKVAPIGSDYGSKDCVNLLASTAFSRFNLK